MINRSGSLFTSVQADRGRRPILFHAIWPMIRAAARELRRLPPLEMRIERFYGCGHMAAIERCGCSKESSDDVFHVRRNPHNYSASMTRCSHPDTVKTNVNKIKNRRTPLRLESQPIGLWVAAALNSSGSLDPLSLRGFVLCDAGCALP